MYVRVYASTVLSSALQVPPTAARLHPRGHSRTVRLWARLGTLPGPGWAGPGQLRPWLPGPLLPKGGPAVAQAPGIPSILSFSTFVHTPRRREGFQPRLSS